MGFIEHECAHIHGALRFSSHVMHSLAILQEY
jgi:hypothetical protein